MSLINVSREIFISALCAVLYLWNAGTLCSGIAVSSIRNIHNSFPNVIEMTQCMRGCRS